MDSVGEGGVTPPEVVELDEVLRRMRIVIGEMTSSMELAFQGMIPAVEAAHAQLEDVRAEWNKAVRSWSQDDDDG